MTTKKCTGKRDTRANLLLCLINLFSAVLTISRLSPSLKLPSVQTRVLVHKRHIWLLRAWESIQFWVLWKNILPLKLRHNDRWYIAENCLFTTIFYIKSVLCSDFNFPVTHFVFDTCDETFSFFLTENCLAESCFLLYDFSSFFAWYILLSARYFERHFQIYHYGVYKHQWNTRWAFTRKHVIFTCENITVAIAT